MAYFEFVETENLRLPYGLWIDDARSQTQGTRKAAEGEPYGDRAGRLMLYRFTLGVYKNARLPYARLTVAVEPLYGMNKACLIATANLKMKKVITPRYNHTATCTSCKERDTP